MSLTISQQNQVISTTNSLELCFRALFSLEAESALGSMTPADKDNFKAQRKRYTIAMAKYRNKTLQDITNWLQGSGRQLNQAISNLENQVDDFNNAQETISAISQVVGVIVRLVGAIP